MSFKAVKNAIFLVFLSSLVSIISRAQFGFPIKIAIPNGVGETNVGKIIYAQDVYASQLIYEPLLRFNYLGQLEGVLAEKWEFDKKDSMFWIYLTNSKKFSDGSELDAVSVKKSIAYLCKAENITRSILKGISGCGTSKISSSIKIKNSFTIGFKISVDPSAFIYSLATGNILVFKFSNSMEMIGSGPYVIEDKKPKLTLTPNIYFNFSRKSVAKHKKIEFIHVPESTLTSELRSGNIDMAFMYLNSLSAGLQITNYNEVQFLPTITQVLVLNPRHQLFQDKRIREQILKKIALDKRIVNCHKRFLFQRDLYRQE